MCELRLAEGKLFLFLAIDRVSKLTRVAFFDANTKRNGAAAFLRVVVAAFPDRIPTVLTDNRWPGGHRSDLRSRRGPEAAKGMAFAAPPKYRDGPTARRMGHIFDRVGREHGITHKLTKPYHPRGDLLIAVPAGTDRWQRHRWTTARPSG